MAVDESRSELRRRELVRVLLVEDCPDHAALISAKLKKATRLRAEITHVDRVSSGLERIADGSFDVVLLDFSLPDSFGIDTFRSVHEAAPRLPIIVLTSLDDNQLAVQAVREGAQDYLIKREADTRLLVR
ncbi:MAG: response regulator, partial [Acidobacteria bacterium]|nr:response regulator [Candidatus Sulfomarinibacter sp. MAG AM2]